MGDTLKRCAPSRSLRFIGVLLCLGLGSTFASTANGAADASDASDASTANDATDAGDASDAEAGPADADVLRLRRTAEGVAALTHGTLALEVTPQALFDCALDDERAVALETRRLSLLQSAVRETTKKGGTTPARQPDAGLTRGEADLWAAQLALDNARLAFLVLPADKREALLAAHRQRQIAAAPPPTPEELRAREAEAERQRAQKAALEARTEAERVVSTEYARLLDLERAQIALQKTLEAEREALTATQEVGLVWQRRAKEAREQGNPEKGDETYDELRKALRAARDDLDAALEATRKPSGVPDPGPDALAQMPASVDMAAPKEARARVVLAEARLTDEVARLREDRAAQLLAQTNTLNAERLSLLPYLSPAKRDALTGFGEAGLNQGTAEAQQLTLILRYHQHAIVDWLSTLRKPGQSVVQSAGRYLLLAFEWLFAILAFVWIRRRVPKILRRGVERSVATDREERRTSPGWATRGYQFAYDVHLSVEWLALVLGLSALLPASSLNLLEVQLITLVVQWTLGGALTVDVVNALAGEAAGSRQEADTIRSLRLRSLRLVGRIVVAVGLVLSLTERLVGKGTIYQWALSTCWLASVPVVVLLVRWWRGTIFQRLERARKKATFERWVLAHQRGWRSFFAALAGGAYLFVRGGYRVSYGWVGRFSATRTVLAYLFRRQLDKLSAERTDLATAPLPALAFDALGPERASPARIPVAELEDKVEQLIDRLRNRKGGVVAIVGARGMGKSTLLRRMHDMFPDSILAGTEGRPHLDLRTELAVRIGVTAGTLGEVSTHLLDSAVGRAVLIDDAQRLIQPTMGGLLGFDQLLAAAVQQSAKTTWIVAIDEILWLFLQRARGSRPMFDEVIRLSTWREEEIISLLQARTKVAGLTPTFEGLLEKLPKNADEVDRQEALAQRAANYYRLLWDYAVGNPGIALHMWRRSLGVDDAGLVHVRFFQAPETGDLERLPDAAIFVLRAILQLSMADPKDIAKATMLSHPEVEDALRYAQARGYISEENGYYSVTWAWLRPVVTHLQRRHLVAT